MVDTGVQFVEKRKLHKYFEGCEEGIRDYDLYYDKIVICNHFQGCKDKECPHHKPHFLYISDYSGSCTAVECYAAPYGTECMEIEFFDINLTKEEKDDLYKAPRCM